MEAAGDGVRHHTVDPDAGQHQRGRGKRDQPKHRKAAFGKGFCNHLLHALDVVHGLIVGGAGDLGTNGRDRAQRGSRRARHQVDADDDL